MNTQTNESPADDRFANVAVQLDELLERGEISPEAFAVYAAMADTALASILDSGGHAQHAPTQFVDAYGIRFAYRRFGKPAGKPVVLLQIVTDNTGVGRSTTRRRTVVVGLEVAQ